MSFTGKSLSFLGLASLAVSVASAQSLPPSVAACTAEKDSLARLVCFDREVAKFTQSAAVAAPRPAPPAAAVPTAPAAPTASVPTPAAPTPAAVSTPGAAPTPPTPAVAATPAAVATPNADKFGMSNELARKRAEARQEVDTTPKELRGAVTDIKAKPYGELVLTLDNGQVWLQNEANTTFIIKVGDGVVIKAAKMGSFMLTTSGGATTRVHRIH